MAERCHNPLYTLRTTKKTSGESPHSLSNCKQYLIALCRQVTQQETTEEPTGTKINSKASLQYVQDPRMISAVFWERRDKSPHSILGY